MDLEGIRAFIGADSIGYLELEDLQACVKDEAGDSFCYACFTGDYPVTPSGRGTCG